MAENSNSQSLAWLFFAFLTVASWGVYGILLHLGQLQMKPPGAGNVDPSILRYKAFLFVGVAYVLVAVLAPLFLLMTKGAAFSGYTASGAWWSLLAGIVGAIGAFGVLLAFGAAPKPTANYVPVIMSIIFAGAPVVNAVVSIIMHPPEGGVSSIKPLFFVGILLAAVGGCLVTFYKPESAPAKPQAAPTAPANPSGK